MALIKCPDCGKMVSDRASVCPNCGYPIEEEVKKINSVSNDELYVGKTEKEIAEYYLEALMKHNAADMNLFQAILAKKNQDSNYVSLILEAQRMFSSEEEKNEYIIENFRLLIDYLDYDLDEKGFYGWNGDLSLIKGRGFFQTTDDSEAYDKYIDYYINSDIYLIYEMDEVFEDLFPNKLKRRVQESSKYTHVLILKKNKEKYERLIQKSKEFLRQLNSKNISQEELNNIIYIDGFCIDIGDLFVTGMDTRSKYVVDRQALQSRQINAYIDSLKMELNERKPMSTTSSMVAGAVIGGIPGTFIGREIAVRNEAKYEYAKKYNEKLRREKQISKELAASNDMPMKLIEYSIDYYGLMTYAGIYPFYMSDEYEEDKEMEKNGILFYKTNLKELRPKRKKQAEIFLKTGEYWEKLFLYVYDNGKTYEEMLEEKKDYYEKEKRRKLEKEINDKLLEAEAEIESPDIKTVNNGIRHLEILAKTVPEAEELIKKAHKNIEIINKKAEEEREEQKRRAELNQKLYIKKRNKSILIGVSITAVVIALIVGWVLYSQDQKSKIYQNAATYYNNGDYNNALRLFVDLGEYKNSKEMAIDCKKKEAMALFNKGDYTNSVATFNDLSSYGASQDQINEAMNQCAMKLFDKGDYDNAKIFLNDSNSKYNKFIEMIELMDNKYLSNDELNECLKYIEEIDSKNIGVSSDDLFSKYKYMSDYKAMLGAQMSTTRSFEGYDGNPYICTYELSIDSKGAVTFVMKSKNGDSYIFYNDKIYRSDRILTFSDDKGKYTGTIKNKNTVEVTAPAGGWTLTK